MTQATAAVAGLVAGVMAVLVFWHAPGTTPRPSSGVAIRQPVRPSRPANVASAAINANFPQTPAICAARRRKPSRGLVVTAGLCGRGRMMHPPHGLGKQSWDGCVEAILKEGACSHQFFHWEPAGHACSCVASGTDCDDPRQHTGKDDATVNTYRFESPVGTVAFSNQQCDDPGAAVADAPQTTHRECAARCAHHSGCRFYLSSDVVSAPGRCVLYTGCKHRSRHAVTGGPHSVYYKPAHPGAVPRPSKDADVVPEPMLQSALGRNWPCNVPLPDGSHTTEGSKLHGRPAPSKALWYPAQDGEAAIKEWSGSWTQAHGHGTHGLGNRMLALGSAIVLATSAKGAVGLVVRNLAQSNITVAYPNLGEIIMTSDAAVKLGKNVTWSDPFGGHSKSSSAVVITLANDARVTAVAAYMGRLEQGRTELCHFFTVPPVPRLTRLPGPNDVIIGFRTYAFQNGKRPKGTYASTLVPYAPKEWPFFYTRLTEVPYRFYDRVLRENEFDNVWVLVNPSMQYHPTIDRLIQVHGAEIHQGDEKEDLRFMSYFSNIVVAPSTYYWWSALLAPEGAKIWFPFGGNWPTDWCAMFMTHARANIARVSYTDLYTGETFPSTAAGAAAAQGRCQSMAKDPKWGSEGTMTSAFMTRTAEIYCEGHSCDAECTPAIWLPSEAFKDNRTLCTALPGLICKGESLRPREQEAAR